MILKGRVVNFNDALYDGKGLVGILTRIKKRSGEDYFLLTGEIFGYGMEDDDYGVLRNKGFKAVLAPSFSPLVLRKLISTRVFPLKVSSHFEKTNYEEISINLNEWIVEDKMRKILAKIKPLNEEILRIMKSGLFKYT